MHYSLPIRLALALSASAWGRSTTLTAGNKDTSCDVIESNSSCHSFSDTHPAYNDDNIVTGAFVPNLSKRQPVTGGTPAANPGGRAPAPLSAPREPKAPGKGSQVAVGATRQQSAGTSDGTKSLAAQEKTGQVRRRRKKRVTGRRRPLCRRGSSGRSSSCSSASSDTSGISYLYPFQPNSNEAKIVADAQVLEQELLQVARRFNAGDMTVSKPVPNLKAMGYGIELDEVEEVDTDEGYMGIDPVSTKNKPWWVYEVWDAPTGERDLDGDTGLISRTYVRPSTGELIQSNSENGIIDTRTGANRAAQSAMMATAFKSVNDRQRAAVPRAGRLPLRRILQHKIVAYPPVVGSDGTKRDTLAAIRLAIKEMGHGTSKSELRLRYGAVGTSPGGGPPISQKESHLRLLIVGQTHGRSSAYTLRDHPAAYGGGFIITDVVITPGYYDDQELAGIEFVPARA